MLVLQRQVNETIRIGNETLRVVSIGKQTAVVTVGEDGATAPQKVTLELNRWIVIAHEVSAILTWVRHQRVRIGIQAPLSVFILRGELE